MTRMDRKIIYGGGILSSVGRHCLLSFPYLFLSLKFNLALPLRHREGSSPS